MVMQATVPQNQPQQLDSVLTLASAPVDPPKYGKISSIGLYIKYNPGSNTCSLQKFTRHKRTNKYATAGNSTAFSLSKIELQRLTGYRTVIASKFDRQDSFLRKHTDQYSTDNFLPSTVRTTGTPRNTHRQELYSKKFALYI